MNIYNIYIYYIITLLHNDNIINTKREFNII